MSDKEKIRAEIARLQNVTMDKFGNFNSAYSQGEYDALCALEHFIDSLPEEPVKDLEDFAKEYSFNIPSDVFHNLPEEKQALWKREIENAIVVGANWQKEQMIKTAVPALKLKNREKIKVIVIKEEEK